MNRRHWMSRVSRYLALGAWPLNGLAANESPKGGKAIEFGLIAPRSAEEVLTRWTPFFQRLSAALGVPVNSKAYSQQSALVQDFKNDKLDFAWVGNLPALELVESGTASVFAQLVVDHRSAYQSLLIVPEHSNLRSVDDVVRKAHDLALGIGERSSTSGSMVPRYFAFAKRGMHDPETAFRSVREASHQENLRRTATAEVDVATCNTTELEIHGHAHPDLAPKIRVIWKSPNIPESPLVWHKNVPDATRAKVQRFVLRFGSTANEQALLRDMNNLTGFKKSTNAQLVPIADLDMFHARQQVIDNSELSPEQRTRHIEAIIRRGSRLEYLLKRMN
jgi:phosphonate transport system substrate-binding protein